MTALRISLVIASCACSSRPIATPKATADRIAIIAAESGPQGARLVVLDETGNRQFDLLRAADSIVRETHPVVSPDGAWIVFASSRGQKLEETSLWIARVAADAEPVRLTRGAIDSHPIWTRDGKAIVFASTRDGGDFDLFELAIDGGRARGEPVQLTLGAAHEVTPTIDRDGTIIYAAIAPRGGAEVESHLEARAPDGTITQLTPGPADTSPALSPDDRTIVFARPKEHNGEADAELWFMPRNGDVVTQLVDLPLTDESGPVWSHDGRYLFATSVLRGAAGNPVFSSVIVIDTRARPTKARLLQDRVGAIARLTPAIATAQLDERTLASIPEYLPELARIMAAAMASQKAEQSP